MDIAPLAFNPIREGSATERNHMWSQDQNWSVSWAGSPSAPVHSVGKKKPAAKRPHSTRKPESPAFEAVDGRDARVVEPSQHLGFALEPRWPLRFAGKKKESGNGQSHGSGS
jgi:hypothetical protein